jgi:peptide/nickel transport system substrate-binding protein
MTSLPKCRAPRIGVIVLTWTLVIAGCTSSTAPDRSEGATITFAAADEPPGFNFNKEGNETPTTRDVAQNLYFYAFKADPDFRRTFPGLERPPTVVSTDPQVIEWKIRAEAEWSDGTPVTSEDLRYFREQLVAKDSLSVEHEGYDQMGDVSVVDAKTIRTTFVRPYADYETLWTAVPQAAFLKAHGGFNTALDESPGPSAGPFQFEAWRKGESLTLVRNPRWWGDPKPGLSSIVFRFIPEASAQFDALTNGEVDMIAPDLDLDLVERVRNARGVRTSFAFGPTWDLFTFNLRNAALADVRVRRAIAHAVDRQAILDKVMKPITPDVRRLDNFIHMTNDPDYEAHGPEYRVADADAARRMLDEAGWAVGADGIRSKDGVRLSLRILAPSGLARFEQAAELATSELKSVGIELRSDNCDLNCLVERAYKGDFDIISAGWSGNVATVSLIKGIFSTSGAQNWGKFSSPAFDALITQAASVPDASQQAVVANRADEVLWDQLPGLPLYQDPTLFAVNDRFVGMAANPNGDGIFWNSHSWGVRG